YVYEQHASSFVCVAFFCFLLKYTYCLYFQLFYSFACHLPFLYFTYFFFFNEFIHALCIFFCCMFTQSRNFDCYNFLTKSDNKLIRFFYIGTCFSNYTVYSNTSLITDLFS